MIKHILFDVDHTLYPASSGIEEEMIRRLIRFTADFLKVSPEEAAHLRATRDKSYDSTLDWLRRGYGFNDEQAFFSYIHPTDLENYFPKNRALIEMMENISVPCSVFTNSWSIHAENVLRHLEIEKFFRKIYDLRFCNLVGKPNRSAFEAVLSDLKLPPEEVLLIDDRPGTVTAFMDMGGHGVLVDEKMKKRDGFPAPVIKEITQLPTCFGLL